MNSAQDTKIKLYETTSDTISPFASATPDELFVTRILLELGNLFPFPRFPWGCSRRRSCLDAPPSAVQIAGKQEIEVRRPLVEAEEEVASTTAANTNAATSSPATPLAFPPSESDGNSKPSSEKILDKRSRADISDTIEELTHQGDLLRVKVENARKRLNELKAQNSDLKAMKQEALKTHQSKEREREMGRFLNLGMDFIQHDETMMLPHRQPFVADLTAQKLHHPLGPIRTQVRPANNGLESVNGVGPSGIPDLNITAEETVGMDSTQPLDVIRGIDDRRTRYAEARRVRRGRIKAKSIRSGSGIKLPP